MTSEPSYTANQSGSSDLSVGATVVRAASREIPEDRVAPLLQGPPQTHDRGKGRTGTTRGLSSAAALALGRQGMASN